MNRQFIEACKAESLPGTPTEWNRRLIGLRKAKALTHLCPMQQTRLPKHELDIAEFGSEAAMSILEGRYGMTLDSILCDPKLAKQFDIIAGRFAPRLSPLHFRWGALHIRKAAHKRNKAANALDTRLRKVRFGSARELNFNKSLEELPAVYILSGASGDPLYVGATQNLSSRIAALPNQVKIQDSEGRTTKIDSWRIQLPRNLNELAPLLEATDSRYGFQAFKIKSLKPRFNRKELTSVSA